MPFFRQQFFTVVASIIPDIKLASLTSYLPADRGRRSAQMRCQLLRRLSIGFSALLDCGL